MIAAAMVGQAAVNTVNGALNNYYTAWREAEARRENYKYNEMSADAADKRTRALYEDYYSPQAMLRQYKEAGLSPSLMFANGAGGSGATPNGAQGNGSTGISPTTYGISPIDIAQIQLANAQAKKENAEADRIEAKNDRGKAELENIVMHTQNVGLKNAWQEYENALKEISLTVEASTFEKKIDNFYKESEYLVHKVRSASVQADIDEQTKQNIIDYMYERTRNIIAETLLKKSEKELNEAKVKLTEKQIEDLTSQIITRAGELEINKGNLETRKQELEKQVEQWCKENGLTERSQQIAISKMIIETYQHGGDQMFSLLGDLLSLGGGKKRK